jgi:tRNA dimethylallyltransferase
MSHEHYDILVITGATASGKSALAMDIAQKQNGVILNADSMQIYHDLRIITARPTEADEAATEHRLYGIMDGAQHCTVARWIELVSKEIKDCFACGRLPILVGGTGMYLKSLMDGIAQIPEIHPEIRKALRERAAEEGIAPLYAWLCDVDLISAAKLKPNDAQRILRAAEVYEQTGTPLSSWLAMPPARAFPNATFHVQGVVRDRAEQYARINARFMLMMEDNALGEIRALHARKLSPELPIMRTLGVPELIAHLEGEMTLEDAITKGQQKTRNYAKRQGTWLRHQFPNAEIIEMN